MSGYALTPLAKADIFDIWSYIAEDSEYAANLVEHAIYDACAFVAEAPLRGHSRPDLTNRSLRFWTLTRYPNYTVVYRPETAPPSGCRRSAREKKHTAHREAARVISARATFVSYAARDSRLLHILTFLADRRTGF